MDDVDSVARSVDRGGAVPGDDGSVTPLPETVRISFLLRDFRFELAHRNWAAFGVRPGVACSEKLLCRYG
ncbi:hypothetical protein PR202_gb24616 [Eleusine coracana subsp. coracana]|uniref:Uncharacterized protein n=1 Tax=Eleusine coracana subsp. coracana TaxID=191504 RepID=A0AAV5FLV1_ELECO|nr:hypothetical protein PR202_gb24616 [Eleusine coracana subsp. coracana]